MSAKQQKVVIKIPKQFDPSERKAIANEIVQFIVKRTRYLGLDKNDKPFKKYSKQYAINKGVSQTDVDLTLSSEMLDELKYLSDKSGSITIGYDDPNLYGKVEGNILGTYGQDKPIPGKKRDFLGISKKELNRLVSEFEDIKAVNEGGDGAPISDEELAQALAESLIEDLKLELEDE